MPVRPRLAFVLGPTATGKTDMALRIAESVNGAIMNADSLQVYRDLNIGTAKPSVGERAKAPHFLFDFVSVGERYTAGDYRRDALEVIEGKWKTQPLLIVGGSGFYVQALEKGMFDVLPVPDEVKKQVEQEIEQRGLFTVHQEMEKLDPEYGAKVPPTDRYRIIRAVSLMRAHGKTVSEIRKSFQQKSDEVGLKEPRVKVGLFLERAELEARVKTRIEKMMKAGLVEETQALVERAGAHWAPLQSVGYREVVQHLNGELTADEAKSLIAIHTMQLAKKQMTWFKRDTEIQWFHAVREVDAAEDQLMKIWQ